MNTYIYSEMNTKLTLTIQKEVIQVAKEYAKEKGQSLSQLVENYFKLISSSRRKIEPVELSARVQKLRGIIKTDGPVDYKAVLEEELSKKYGL